jgi:pyruvate ferredoxin oxidoreductase gamma subunit
MYRIRLHGRGGQGIKTAGQVLGSAFFAEGYEVQDAPRYGAERRGAPIFSYVRASKTAINERGIIAQPDLIVLADPSLAQVPSAGVLQGADSGTVLLIASAEPGATWRERLAFAGTVLTAHPDDPRERPTASLVGASARLVGAIGAQSLEAALRKELAAFGEAAVERNVADALAVYAAFAPHAGCVREGRELTVRETAPPDWVELPLDEAYIAAPDLHRPASSELARTGVWRTERPVIDYDLCHRCSWICSTLCPDGAIMVEADRTPRIDYDHCKGCLVCVTVCPPHAVSVVPEAAP